MSTRNPRSADGDAVVSAPDRTACPRGGEPRGGPFLAGEPVQHEAGSAAGQHEQQQRNG
ncbi:hypothetical protein [Amycolatopsis sp. Poz14]|uniref:hypothetical protein n=1 Tax=Amycolatopsis sp. Poz14 TaxID=1447705 RepID=UPI001EE8A582|nr:hypothetical protein [Amycolatopsis sp. Poz14]MCG3750994.1 hypothetical protein [Amycolatopsis sp. Poz14]